MLNENQRHNKCRAFHVNKIVLVRFSFTQFVCIIIMYAMIESSYIETQHYSKSYIQNINWHSSRYFLKFSFTYSSKHINSTVTSKLFTCFVYIFLSKFLFFGGGKASLLCVYALCCMCVRLPALRQHNV